VHIFGHAFVPRWVYAARTPEVLLGKMRSAEDYRRWERLVAGRRVQLRYVAAAAVLASLCLALVLRPPGERTVTAGLFRFSSEAEFRRWITSTGWMSSYLPRFTVMSSEALLLEAGFRASAERFSVTNVQVAGIDEPDVVKTDGINIYFSPSEQIFHIWWWIPGLRDFWDWPDYPVETRKTHIIRAYPPSDLAVRSKIDKSGDLLLVGNILVVISYDGITGFDVSNPDSPAELWNIELRDQLVAARLHEGRIYAVLQSYVSQEIQFPLIPLRSGERDLEINVTDIYHPPELIPFDTVFTAVVIDPTDGRLVRSVSFVGQSGSSVVYMSRSALYITYTYWPSPVGILHDFIKRSCADVLLPEDMLRIDKLVAYDLSDETKLRELATILEPYTDEISRRAENYFAGRMRELELTGIVKIALENFEISAHGRVPGAPLNQFSLDEHRGYLRVATTIEPNLWILPGPPSANDVYVLDSDLRIVGSVQNLGLTERIYSVRFAGDKGYVVTFRETDPFYVLDLSDPGNPRLAGELKIPGYSSYLHPITENLILGAGREDWNVKISLFDVSDPSEPAEMSKVILEEHWSEVLETHHAFLLDPDHEVFFLPAGGAGYVFSYSGGELRQVFRTEAVGVSRAVYIGDFLYLLSGKGVTVIDENSWEAVGTLEF